MTAVWTTLDQEPHLNTQEMMTAAATGVKVKSKVSECADSSTAVA